MTDLRDVDVIVEHRWDKSQGRCACRWSPDYRNTHKSGLELHAEHVVSKLTDAGYSIIETARHERLQRGASELGHRLGRQLQDVLDLTGAHDLIDKDGDGDWMRVWEKLGELVAKGQQYEQAGRIEAAKTTEETRAIIGEYLGESDDRVHALTISDLTLCGLEMGWGRSGSFSRSHVTCGDCTAERMRRSAYQRGGSDD
ncbi:hypothetical protein CH255_19705 [Rhodococcus sp. 05-2255-2A2]|uniref:hypothetical protein n=1 Tax=unclassified Rhodococcus (in: high G+C Gram-positive bacteria) TaxID=192944 RepID=UPI000B9C1834|nr:MULTISPECIES: hypothetical protein [unclassified Rhodococcus (in: high G+C Gram-positive bacteria)]OZE03877.1 hypothetical protein CH250_22555 [Rhodococcus sp. 05-2255-3C]OZE17030.1 hypothetical protein CH255_19705 [Rhodococcus sp. 05-2255-2A2]